MARRAPGGRTAQDGMAPARFSAPFEFALPERQPPARRPPEPEALARWLAELPLANVSATGRQIHEALYRLNRLALEPRRRLALARAFAAAVESVVEQLRRRYVGQALPLRGRAAKAAKAARLLTGELATAFRVTVTEATEDGALGPAQADPAALPALTEALAWTARELLERYLVYAPEPGEVWRALHRLYAYAEHAGRLGRDTLAAQAAYRRAVALSLAQPHQLLPGEALEVDALLLAWAEHVEILDRTPEAGDFCLDLATANPPYRAASRGETRGADTRTVALRGLLDAVHGRLKDIRAEAARHGGRLRLARRQERDRLQRLARAWGAPPKRQAERHIRLGRIEMAGGLSAVHHHVTGGRPFTPELDEIRIHRVDLESLSGRLSLVPKDFEPWRLEEEETRLATGIVRPRTSDFDPDRNVLDMWAKIYATRVQQGPGEAHYPLQPWQQRNAGPGGVGVFCLDECAVGVRTGELVAFRSQEGEPWAVGAVRWLRAPREAAVELGVQRLAGEARGIAVRAVAGAGEGSEYFRALLVPAGEPEEPGRLLVTPPAVYDVGTRVVLNLGERLCYARLTEVADASSGYACFAYEVIEAPKGEQERIEALRQVL